jgi:hypothetical protein
MSSGSPRNLWITSSSNLLIEKVYHAEVISMGQLATRVRDRSRMAETQRGSVHDSPAPKADAWCLKIPGIGISVRVQIPPSAPPTGSRRADSSPAGGLIARHELATVGMSGNALSVADSSGVYKLANDGQDTRALQRYLGHKNIQHTVRYTELSPDRFKSFWEDLITEVAAAMQQFGRYVVKTRN